MAMIPGGKGVKVVKFVDEDDDTISPAEFRRDVMERSARYLREVTRARPDLVVAKPAPAAPRPAGPTRAQQVKAIADETRALHAEIDRLQAQVDAALRARSAQREQARRDQEARLMNTFRW